VTLRPFDGLKAAPSDVEGRPAQGHPDPSTQLRVAPSESRGEPGRGVSNRPELLSIIVPVYNEVRTVRAVIDRLLAIDLPVAREILVVDDGSTDGTREALAGLGTSGSRIPDPESRLLVIHAERNAGKGAAIRLGLGSARGTIVAIQDADLELDPQQIAALVAPIVAGDATVVYGSRFMAGRPAAPWITIAANRVLTGTTNLLFGGSLTDMETCYKIMRADVARSLKLDANRFDIEPQITARLLRGGHRIHELPVKFDPRSRAQGKKIGWRDGVRAVQVLFAERFRPAHQPANPKPQKPNSKSQ
jgi:glycosyltransferase involved in cell wall biosynthesis